MPKGITFVLPGLAASSVPLGVGAVDITANGANEMAKHGITLNHIDIPNYRDRGDGFTNFINQDRAVDTSEAFEINSPKEFQYRQEEDLRIYKIWDHN